MRAYVQIRGPDGTVYELVPGDVIGRLWSAAMQVDDGRVSEAHAMVSLRSQELRLVGLRGAFAVEGRPVNQVTLQPGLLVTLARGLVLEVENVVLPDRVMGLQGPTLGRHFLGGVSSVFAEPQVRITAGYREGAAAWIWQTGESWRLRRGECVPRLVAPGDAFQVGEEELTFVEIPLSAAGQEPTRPHGGVGAPLRIQANFDTVHIHRKDGAAVVLGGVSARIISELAALGGPIHWTGLAGLLWPAEEDPELVRARFDVSLSRLRRRLREDQIRTDLVHSDGSGSIELLLYPHDTLEDRT